MKLFANFALKYFLHMKLNRIKSVLVDKDRSQTWLSEKLGKSFSTVNAYCCNRQQPSLSTLQEIAELLNVDIKDLIIGKEDK